jgi:predicted MFS family arabinose efflux permease
MSGPAVGGVFAGLGLWRGAFWCMVPLAAAAAAATWWLLPGRAAPAERHAGVALGRLALVCVGVLAVASVANVDGAGARLALVTGAVGAIALALRLDARARTRLFPAGMLSPRHAAGQGFWMVFFVAMCTTPGGVYIALLLQAIHGVTPAVAGYFYAAQSLAWTTAALLSARLGATRARGALVVGPAMIASGFAGVWWTLASGPLPAILAAVILLGGGIGACWAHVGAIILGSAREGEGAQTASLIPTTQTFAASLGAALCGIVVNTAGLSSGATPAIAVIAGERLFGVFLVAPLLALLIAARLATARR